MVFKRVPRRRRALRKRSGKKKMMRKRSSNAVTGGPNTCRITETYTLSPTNINTPETYFFEGIPANTRAAAVAPNFGLYRIARVTYTYKPLYDTYTPGLISNPLTNYLATIPNLYWKMNRYGDAPAAFDADYLREQGSRAVRLDDKSIKISYKPNILLADAGAQAAGLNGGSGQVKMTPWLSTDNEPDNNAFALSTTVPIFVVVVVDCPVLKSVTTSVFVPVFGSTVVTVWVFCSIVVVVVMLVAASVSVMTAVLL